MYRFAAEMLLIVFHVSGSTAKGMHVKVTWGCIIFVEHAQNTAAWMIVNLSGSKFVSLTDYFQLDAYQNAGRSQKYSNIKYSYILETAGKLLA